MAPPRAAILDFNGTISDDEPILERLFREVLAGEGIVLTAEAYWRDLAGLSDPEIVVRALEAHGRTADPATCARLLRDKIDRYRAVVAIESPVSDEATAFVHALADAIPVAIASGAVREEIEAVLAGAGILHRFCAIVTIDDVPLGKPHPAGYLAALTQLNRQARPDPPVEPWQVIVVEDATPGVEAALAAGMRCVALRNPAYDEERGRAHALTDRVDAALAGRLLAGL